MTSREIVFDGIPLSVGYNTNGEITDVCVVVNNNCSPDIYVLLDNYQAGLIADQFYKEMEDENKDRG